MASKANSDSCHDAINIGLYICQHVNNGRKKAKISPKASRAPNTVGEIRQQNIKGNSTHGTLANGTDQIWEKSSTSFRWKHCRRAETYGMGIGIDNSDDGRDKTCVSEACKWYTDNATDQREIGQSSQDDIRCRPKQQSENARSVWNATRNPSHDDTAWVLFLGL